MATEAPRVVAQYVSSSLATPPHTGNEPDLRSLVQSEDAEALWNEIYSFVQTKPLPTSDTETITQDLFLHLLSVHKSEDFLAGTSGLDALLKELLARQDETLA